MEKKMERERKDIEKEKKRYGHSFGVPRPCIIAQDDMRSVIITKHGPFSWIFRIITQVNLLSLYLS